MRKILAAVAMVSAAMSMGCQLAPSPSQMLAIEERERAAKPKPIRKRRENHLAAGTPRWKRSRGAQAKPKKHRNRITISRRVRRRHRRCA